MFGRKALAATVLTTLVSIAVAQVGIEICKAPVSNEALREFRVKASSRAYSNVVFDNYCSFSGSVRSEADSKSFGLVYEALAFNFSGENSTDETRLQQYCRDYASNRQAESSQFEAESTIVKRAFESFDQCISYALAGARIEHTVVDYEGLTMALTPPRLRPIVVQGTRSSDGISCFGRLGDRGGAIDLDFLKLRRPVTVPPEQTLNIVCEREVKATDDGSITYTPASVTLLSDFQNNANYTAWLPADTLYPENRASVLNQQIGILESSVATLEQKNVELAASSEAANYRLNNLQVGAEVFTTGSSGGPVFRHFPCDSVTATVGAQSLREGWTIRDIRLLSDTPGGPCGIQVWLATYTLIP